MVDWRLSSHHGLSYWYLPHHSTRLDCLALNHHWPGLLSHHLGLLDHHLPRLLSHNGRLLDHHLPWLLLLRNHLSHNLALDYLHLLTWGPHLHAGSNGSHEPSLHHLHRLALDWGSHAYHVWLGRALPVRGHVAGTWGHGVDGRHSGGGGVGWPT